MNEKINVLDIQGKKIKEIEMPEFFKQKIREDIISKIIESRKSKQPYAPSPVAGKQHSASGLIRHRRHVWKTHYGQGRSRIPRKIISKKGNRINWIGAEIPSTRGGRRAHPPRVEGTINANKINRKELRIALLSALSASANPKEIKKKYENLREKNINAPFVVDGKITELKTKEVVETLGKVLGEAFGAAISKKSIRAGKGKRRGRKYKETAGALIVLGNSEKIKTNIIESKNVSNLNVIDLSNGGQGKLTIYTENAIKDLNERLNKTKEEKEK
ncbi:MAG: 50S ribosomal protein L4 [Nanoarchaeota archaeon]